MLAYASRTGTRKNLEALRRSGWGLLICASADGARDHRDEGFGEIMLDNGAWKTRDAAPDAAGRLRAWRETYERPFCDLVDAFGRLARLIVLPDVIAGGHVSLMQSVSWVERLEGTAATLLLPVQDGMRLADVRPYVGGRVGIFVGGSTDWKWRSLREEWGPLASDVGCWLHVGRAGSGRMVERCALAGADSFDTSEPSRYACKLPGLDNARRQMVLGEQW